MLSSTKKKIKVGLVFAAIMCLVSFPAVPLTLAMHTMCFPPSYGYPTRTADFAVSTYPPEVSTLAGRDINISILVSSTGKFNGTISLSATLPKSWSANFALSSLELMNGNSSRTKLTVSVPSNVPVGAVKIEVTGNNGSVTRSVNVTVNVVEPDFRLYARPSTLRMFAGTTGNLTFGAFALFEFSGDIALTAVSPTGWYAATFASTSLSITPDEHDSTEMLITVPSDAAVGRYFVEVTGTSGSLTHSINVTIQVIAPDFRVFAVPPRTALVAGASQDITVIVNPINRFNGTVNLSVEDPAEITATPPDPVSVEIKYNASSTATLTITVPATTAMGRYVVTVTGTSGELTHKANVTVQVVRPEFTVSTYTPRLSISAGSAKNVSIKVSPLNGFTGTVDLSLSAPADWTATALTQTSLTITGRSNSTILTIVVPPTATIGNYTLTVTGTSGALTNSTNITVKVR